MEKDEDKTARGPSKTPLISRTNVRRFILAYCKRCSRPYVAKHYSRVAESVYVELNQHVRDWCRKKVNEQPSKGKTVI